MKHFLGIDQGGTKTIAIVCDIEGNIKGVGYESGLETVHFQDTAGIFINRIRSAAEEACKKAGINLGDVSAVCGGLNGADWDFEYHALTEKLQQALLIEDAIVVNDCIGAMRGGSDSKNCAVVCAGSALNAAVRRADGEEIIYGYYIDGAHCGGSALGAGALRKVMQSHLQLCGETVLTDLVLSYTGHSNPEELLIELTMDRYKLHFKDLAPILLQAYADGDIEACSIVDEFNIGVAKYITAAIKRLDMTNISTDLVLSGSVFKNNGALAAEALYKEIIKETPNVNMIHGKYEPVCGTTLILLDREYNNNIPIEVNNNFEKTAGNNNLIRSLNKSG